jgi:subtilase family serine protease
MFRAAAAVLAATLTTAATLTIAVTGAAQAGGAASAPAAGASEPTGASPVRSACPAPGSQQAQCLSLIRVGTSAGTSAGPDATVPQGLGPASLESAYDLPVTRGAGQLIAIVDAFDDPAAEADLNIYRAQYGLPACTTANGCFRKVNQDGVAGNYPVADPGWIVEISLDLDMVSAACPDCDIALVEANSNADTDLAAAVNTAANLAPAAISNSYGTQESGAMLPLEADYDHPGTTIVAASGDSGYGPPEYPAVFGTVLAVGGTSLQAAHNSRGWKEQAWSGSGSGCSAYVAKPAWQQDPDCPMRTVTDVSAVADPSTGVAVYDSTPDGGSPGWLVVGGTSAATPLIAGVVGLAGNGGITPAYPYSHAAALNDVTAGSNGTCEKDYVCTARHGYDGPTGLGTPHGTGAF